MFCVSRLIKILCFVHIGYYARIKAVGDFLRKFLKITMNKCQVISLGAGFDTSFWNLQVIMFYT